MEHRARRARRGYRRTRCGSSSIYIGDGSRDAARMDADLTARRRLRATAGIVGEYGRPSTSTSCWPARRRATIKVSGRAAGQRLADAQGALGARRQSTPSSTSSASPSPMIRAAPPGIGAAERRRSKGNATPRSRKHPELSDRLPDELREDFEPRHERAEARSSRYGAPRVVRGVQCRRRTAKLKQLAEAARRRRSAAASPQRGRRRRASPTRSRSRRRRSGASIPSKIPAREWLYGGHYQRGIITATVGPGGGGKSSLDLVELIAMCTGRNLLGEQPLLRCRAWYHNAEDGTDEIYRRIAAVCQHYGIDQDELDGWLFVTSGLTMPIKIATATHGPRRSSRRPRSRPSSKPSPPTRSASSASTPWWQRMALPRTSPARWTW